MIVNGGTLRCLGGWSKKFLWIVATLHDILAIQIEINNCNNLRHKMSHNHYCLLDNLRHGMSHNYYCLLDT